MAKKKFSAETYQKNDLPTVFNNESSEVPIVINNDLTMRQLLVNLQEQINKKPSRFKFFIEWEKKKVDAQTEVIQAMVRNIESLRDLNYGYLDLKADHYFSEQTLQMLIDNKQDLITQKMNNELSKHKVVESNYRLEIETNNQKILSLELDNAEKQAQINLMNANTEEQRAFSKFILSVARVIKLLPPEVQAKMFYSYMKKFSSGIKSVDDEELDEFIRKSKKILVDNMLVKDGAEKDIKVLEADSIKLREEKKRKLNEQI